MDVVERDGGMFLTRKFDVLSLSVMKKERKNKRNCVVASGSSWVQKLDGPVKV